MYQYKLTFKLEEMWLPKDMDKLLVSFLKAAAQSYSQAFYEKLYDKSKSIIKTFTFSYFLPGAKFNKDKIELSCNEFSMFFSDADQVEMLHFFNAFQNLKYKRYPMNGNSLQLVSIYMQRLNEIKDNEIVIKMQSPLVVREHNSENNSDMYYTCQMEGFQKALQDNIRIFLDKMDIKLDMEGFSIQVIKAKKVVVPVFGRNTDASIGIFKLTGSCQLLNLLYLAGIGVRRSTGRGKFEVIG